VKKYQKEKEEREKTEVAIAGLQRAQQQQRHPPATPMTPMSSVSHAMQSTTLGSQRGNQPVACGALPPTTNNASPFISQSGGQGNLFPHPPLLPVTQADRDVLQVSLAAYPLPPNTQVGTTMYCEQLQVWKAKHGENTEVTASTGFPLRPGGAAPGSGECYACGMMGHCRTM